MIGKKIVEVRDMTKVEMEREGWDFSPAPTAFVLDSGEVIYPSRDDEGNGPGSLFGYNPKDGTVFRL